MKNDLDKIEVKVVQAEVKIPALETSEINKSKNPKLKLGIALVIILLFIVGGIGINRSMSGPSSGDVSASKPIDSVSIKTLSVEGKTFSFQYPDVFVPTPENSLSANDIEKMSFVYRKESPWNLDISIRSMPSGNLIDDSSYAIRVADKEKYSDQVSTYAGGEIHIVTDISGGYNKVAFIPQARMIAYVSLRSLSGADNISLNKALNQILTTWKWL